MASAGAVPCSMRGSCDVNATARNGVASSAFRAWRYRFSHPSAVLFTPGVAVSM